VQENTILIAKEVNKSFGGVQAVRKLSVFLKEGKITGLIGSNGAGKTTFFNLICGISLVDSGEIEFMGKIINGLRPYQIAQMGITRTFQTLNNFPRLDVFENVRAGIINNFLDKKVEETKVHEMLELIGLSQLAERTVTEIPPVARKLVEAGRALISSPKLVLFDEIMAGFNEEETGRLIDVIRQYNKQGTTFCIIGHTIKAIMDVSDVIIAMHEGSKFVEGVPEEIQRNKDFHKVYVGD
jgi:branched-chain amino acid transport system ATP-binding protein